MTDTKPEGEAAFEAVHTLRAGLHDTPPVDAQPVEPLTAGDGLLREALDVGRLASIMTSRMPDGCYFMTDDGSRFDIVSPATAAAMLAHLYETGDVLSGLAALHATATAPWKGASDDRE